MALFRIWVERGRIRSHTDSSELAHDVVLRRHEKVEDWIGAMGENLWGVGCSAAWQGDGSGGRRSWRLPGELRWRAFGAGQLVSASTGAVGSGLDRGRGGDLSVALVGVQRQEREGGISREREGRCISFEDRRRKRADRHLMTIGVFCSPGVLGPCGSRR